MNTSSSRRNFKCVFNPYVTKDNHDAIVRSVISQFEGYGADPEVTVTDDGFIITLTVSDDLSPLAIRDKILWNRFIERVTTQDSIRKIQIVRLPKSSKDVNEGTVGAFGPNATATGDTGVNEKLNIDHPQVSYIIGDTELGNVASLRYADPTGDMLPATLGPITEDGGPVDENLISDITKMDKPHKNLAKVFMGFRRVSFQSDTGDSFTLNTVNGLTDVNDVKRLTKTDPDAALPGTGLPTRLDSSFRTEVGNASSTAMGEKRVEDSASAAPLATISASVLNNDEPEEEDAISSLDIPQSHGGARSVPDKQVRGWFSSNHFGLNETYDYIGDVDDSSYF